MEDLKRSTSDLVQADVAYKYHTGQTGALKPISWEDKLKRVTPPKPVVPKISVEMEQNFTTWRIEYSFPNFFISAPGAWLGVNIDLQMNADGGWSWNETGWKLEFDLSKWASDVVSEGVVLNVDSTIGRVVARFLGKILDQQRMKLVFIVTANLELETLERASALIGVISLAFWSQEIVLRRARLRSPSIGGHGVETRQSVSSDGEWEEV